MYQVGTDSSGQPEEQPDNSVRSVGSARSAVMEQAKAIAGEPPVPTLRSMVCPYCGVVTPDSGRCSACSGRFDPLSRQATQNQMGPWSIRDDRFPFRPGCTYETIARLIEQGKISARTILRGPTTRQFWTLARDTPGVAHLLGVCHSCQGEVKPDAFACPRCHAPFGSERDRQHLGLGPSRPLPGQGLPEVLALRAEPASQPAMTSAMNSTIGGTGVVSAPIGVQVGTQIGIQIGAHVGASVGADLIDARQQVEVAARLARKWKSACDSQRRHAWVVIGLAVMITMAALSYSVLKGLDSTQSAEVGGTGSDSGSAEE